MALGWWCPPGPQKQLKQQQEARPSSKPDGNGLTLPSPQAEGMKGQQTGAQQQEAEGAEGAREGARRQQQREGQEEQAGAGFEVRKRWQATCSSHHVWLLRPVKNREAMGTPSKKKSNACQDARNMLTTPAQAARC